MWVTSSLTSVLTPTAVALGNFDGVHRGHRQVIQPVLNSVASVQPLTTSFFKDDLFTTHEPNESLLLSPNAAIAAGTNSELPYPTVVTFNPHPQEFFSGQPRALLTTLNEKVLQLQAMGVRQLVLLPFDRELADLSPQAFVEEILVQRLQAQQISVGVDFRFGRQRAGTAADLQAIAATYGIAVSTVPLCTCTDERISSSNIRTALQAGDLQRANRLLGRPYSLMGQVVWGQQLGRTIGFPTANLQLPPEKFLPSHGVYAVQVQSSTLSGLQTPCSAVMNIGHRPTVNGISRTVEIHLLDWDGDLYEQTLIVSLKHFLRPEQKFASLEALKTQIQADCLSARSLLATAPSV
ncbi:bifunctional riboflavin kinase/FAD synthetase [Trichocoleus sp. FACHB-591]|uniref:bifunctional riboflavin kinase/FAD synthetase n=1 Tax=Trichocoleus sp. FACHB-591 TaxID=2692872 RepID=UPI00168488BC|nr:bifunctional riboflavin kinase/FAD synthetase [Trichocoleus sp. FACHB-591]